MLKQDEDSFLRTVAAIEAAGFDEELWPEALRTIATLFGSAGATIEAADKSTLQLTDFWAHGIPPVCEAEYAEHFIAVSPRVPYGTRLAPGDIFYDYLVLDEAEMNRDAYYSDFLPKTDLRYFVSSNLIQNEREYACVAVQRSPREGHVQQREIDMMARLTPHIQQAYDVTRRLRAATQTARTLERALDWLNEGALLVGTDGKVIYANEAARSFARRGDGFRIRRGVLEFPAADIRALFDAALAAVAGARRDAARVPLDFALARTGGAPPYICSIRPVGVSERRFGHTPATAVVFIRDPLRESDGQTADIARQAFGLTEAEAHLASALQAGTSLGQYARTRRLSLNTVYTHLRRIKEKTGARRIADLALKLAELSPPLKGHE